MFPWFIQRKVKVQPQWLTDYLNLDFSGFRKYPIDEAIFIALDCETTGLSPTDDILTIGAVKCKQNEIMINDVLDQHYPQKKVGASSEIHGELSLRAGGEISTLLRELISYIGNHPIIGHNIAFDVGMINKALKKTYGTKLRNQVLDTARLAIRLDPVKYERSVGGKAQLHLDDLCKSFNIRIENRHTALGDAYLTAQLFQRLINLLRKRGVEFMAL